MTTKFAIDRVATAVRKGIKEKAEPSGQRYYRVTFPSGLVVHGLYDPEMLRVAGDMDRTKRELVSPDLERALKLNDDDILRNYKTLERVAVLVAAGHYNDQIIETLRRIAETEKLYDAEAILASAPPRTAHGPIESWCLAALQHFCEGRFHAYSVRAQLEKEAT